VVHTVTLQSWSVTSPSGSDWPDGSPRGRPDMLADLDSPQILLLSHPVLFWGCDEQPQALLGAKRSVLPLERQPSRECRRATTNAPTTG
jgi:hypothetical protein